EFPCNGQFKMKLPYGEYYYEVDHGPAYELLKGNFSVNQKEKNLKWQLHEIIDLKKKNWYAGETHIHRKLEDVPLLMRAADLYVGEVITSWNANTSAPQPSHVQSVLRFDVNRYYDNASEDERGGGALLFFNLKEPFDFSKQKTEYPPLTSSIYKVLEKSKDAWADLEKPFWPDVPILLSTGKINSIGIANNHMLKSGIFDTEAWGKKRDTLKYPSPLGNAYWTQEIYYQILNTGFRIPPSAGSASGVLWNPVGYNRLYAHVNGTLTYAKFWAAVKAGNCFVSNGPILLCKANNQLPGHIFKSNGAKPFTISINAELYSRDSITTIEIIKDGKVCATISPKEVKNNRFTSVIKFEKSGWLLVRAISTAHENFRFASSAPFYVEIGADKKYISKASCQFFIQWLNERAASLKIENVMERDEVYSYINKAHEFWEDLLSKANAE
ncbi:MAG: CehA/McbA family metallohydrolase, partial [Gelidibacter sp.]